ncbi:MAG: hypothetical protein NTX50_02845 [Candidatus Sumerlaeota bacterium]|nr:hypothetical protein [Candidatus Sumerlaeota bacterium]
MKEQRGAFSSPHPRFLSSAQLSLDHKAALPKPTKDLKTTMSE